MKKQISFDELKSLPRDQAMALLYVEPSKDFNCSKVVPKKCQADCCHCVPLPDDVWARNKDKVVNKDYKIIKYGATDTLPLTEDLRCPFSDTKNGYRCAIYADRPHICRVFGSEALKCTSCMFLKASGQKRGKTERTRLEKEYWEELQKRAENIDKALVEYMQEHPEAKVETS